ncbi:hypothetical protein RAS1_13910 [Phycisphaerae bacterium RAS1]|nr:hypothetical protein RAS1_13910 [Phycisphaerae bacterium RAS1]
MNCFQLIKSVLDEAYAEIPGKVAQKDSAINAQLTSLSAEYSNLRKKGCLDYTDPARRFAYLFAYTTAHANLVYGRICGSKQLRSVFDRDQVLVSCIGGGPGSDFLGLLKYCERMNKKPDVTCHLLDRDPAWGESWSDVGQKVGATMKLATHFNPFDVTDPKKWMVFKKHFQADLFTLIYFMSEVYAKRSEASAYFDTLFSSMKKGSFLLFVDNNAPSFYEWFDAYATKFGLTVLESQAAVSKMPLDEDKDDLKPYLDKFRCPKLTSDIAWRVVQK